jgi:diaminohydroxyphosphoribosylaminopyrimidine deaminase/5-amino-6-(5-phosphoribosylamino)uracil reductase
VNLEPCNHFGKTPPCSLRILQEAVPHVVVGCTDPFEAVNGTGVARLRSAGVQVEVGVLAAECRELNQAFFTYHEKKRPWVTLKWAQTADGYLDDTAPEPLPISSAPARRWVHKLRSSRAAIMVGTHTVLADNPLLDNRLWWGRAPLRVITDRSGQVPPQHRIYQNPDTLIVFSNAAPDLFPKGCKVLPIPVPNHERVAYYLQQLYRLNVQSILVEGGGALLHSFLAEGLWDETIVLSSQHVNAGAGIPAPPPPAVVRRTLGRLGSDVIDIYHNRV